MYVDTTIYGYVTDGGAYHPDCTDARPDGDHDDVSAIFSYHDEDPHGLSCDGCYEYIFEPVDVHEYNPEARYACDYGCDAYCGEGASCWLHVGRDEDDDPEYRAQSGHPDTVAGFFPPAIDPLSTLFDIEATGYPVEEA